MPTQTTPAQIAAEAQTCHQGVSLHAHVLTKRATTNDAKQMPSSARVIRRCRYHGRLVTPDVTLGILREDASRSRGMLRGPACFRPTSDARDLQLAREARVVEFAIVEQNMRV